MEGVWSLLVPLGGVAAFVVVHFVMSRFVIGKENVPRDFDMLSACIFAGCMIIGGLWKWVADDAVGATTFLPGMFTGIVLSVGVGLLIWCGTIFRKELAGYFNSPTAYVFIILFLVVSSAYLISFQDFFSANRAEMRALFEGLPYAFLVLVPAVSMRIWAEEKKLKTYQLLMTLPLEPGQIILGKFLAAWAVLCLAVLLTLPVPIAIDMMADLDWGPVIGGYLGAFILVGAYLAVGLFVSGVTDNQLIAFVVTLVILLVMALVGHPNILLGIQSDYPGLADFLGRIGVVGHFENVARGVLDSQDMVYFASLIVFFLGLNRYTIESHRFG